MNKSVIMTCLSCVLLTSCGVSGMIDQSTNGINRNTEAIEKSTKAIDQNLVQLEKISEAM